MSFKMKEKQLQMRLAAEEFAAGEKIEAVMEKYHVSYASVYNALKRYNISYKYTYGRTIFFNEDFFHEIDSEEKAYWLGFIFADGCVCRSDKSCLSENRMTIGLSVKDEEHLAHFAETIGLSTEKIIHTFPKHSYSGSEMVYLHCNSTKMATDLKALNCVPRKTLHSEMPPIDESLYRHFIRGYFDGDGSIGRSFELTSDGNMLQNIQTILMENCNLNATKIRFRKNAYNLRYGGRRQLDRIYHYLYDDATVYLQRKYDKFHSIAFAIS